jgi:hypothetical protein
VSEPFVIPSVAPQFHGAVEHAVSVGMVYGDFYNVVREPLAAHALGSEDIKAARDVYVKVSVWDDAVKMAKAGNLVGLLGAPGSSRWITAVDVAAELRLTPSLLELDPDDRSKSLPADSATCYLLDLATADELVTPGLGVRLRDHARALGAVGSRLIVLATQQLWRACGWAANDDWVPVSSPPPLEVFRAHLAHMRIAERADAWAGSPQMVAALSGVTSADAVWLATLVDAAVRRGLPSTEALDEVLQAYRDWPESISELLVTTAGEDDGYARALAVAVAVLEQSPAARVFASADILARAAGVTRSPGAGLVGPGATAMLSSVNAGLTADDCVYFPRIGYGSALLDHMWRDRHRFRLQLREWFAAAPRDVGADAVWAPAIARLAVRHRDPELVIEVAESWASGTTNALAVQALSDAAISDEAGPTVRRRLYYWATHGNAAGRHELTADVCGGEMGRRYPRIALTRLRHLATLGTDAVRRKVVAAVVALAVVPSSRAEAVHEIRDWLHTGNEGQRATGRTAFLALVRTDDVGAIAVLAAMLNSHDDVGLLSDCWWSVLRDAESRLAARAEFVSWLEAAMAESLPWDGVLECLSRACRSALDAGDIGLFLQDWAVSRESEGSSAAGHAEIIDELSRRTSRSGASRVLTLARPAMIAAPRPVGGVQ